MLLALDYPGFRTQAQITDLDLPHLVNLLSNPLPLVATAEGYTTELISRVPSDRVDAVLGYCASAPLAARVAALLAKPTPLVLFDAEPVTAHTVLDAYRDTAKQLGVLVDAPAIDPIAEPEGFLLRARTDLRTHVSTALLGDGCPAVGVDELAAELTGACLAWLTHLLAAADAEPTCLAGPVLRVVSRGRSGGDVTIDCAADDLLRHPETRAAVRAFLLTSG